MEAYTFFYDKEKLMLLKYCIYSMYMVIENELDLYYSNL